MAAEVARGDEVPAIASLDHLQDFLTRLRENWGTDPEAAHGIEDALKSQGLRLAAEGHPEAPQIARELLAMDDWDVPRWYA